MKIISDEIIWVGDLHLRSDSRSHFYAATEFLAWLSDFVEKTTTNKTLFFVGDVFHEATPPPECFQLFNRFVDSLPKATEVLILAGNHDHRTYKGEHHYSVQGIERPNVKVIYKPGLLNFSEQRIVVLPWYPKCENDYTRDHLPSEYMNADVVTYHFPDETQSFGGKNSKFDISFLKPKRFIGGDIHLQTDRYIGTPFPTRYDERGQQGRIFFHESNGSISQVDLPQFLDFDTVEYGNEVTTEAKYTILTIHNAPSQAAAKEIYSNYDIRLIKTIVDKSSKKESTSKHSVKESSSVEYLESFKKNYQIDEKVYELMKKRIQHEVSQ